MIFRDYKLKIAQNANSFNLHFSFFIFQFAIFIFQFAILQVFARIWVFFRA
jgi:hypothetical protein